MTTKSVESQADELLTNMKEGLEKFLAPEAEFSIDRGHLLDAALAQVCIDVESDGKDLSGIYELLQFVPEENLYKFLSDDIRAQLHGILDQIGADDGLPE